MKINEGYDRRQLAKEDKIIAREVATFDISRYEPSQDVLDTIENHMTGYYPGKVNVKAIKTADKLLTYYYAAAILKYDDLMSKISWRLANSWDGFIRPYRGSPIQRSVFPELRLRTDMSEFKVFNDYDNFAGRGPDQQFILGILDKIEKEAKNFKITESMRSRNTNMKLDENQKITLTVGQLKRLVREAKEEDPVVEVYVDATYEDDEISKPITCKKVEDFYSSLIENAGYNGVTVICTNPEGPGGGWPEITLKGYRSIIKKVLEDIWGMEDDADDYIDSCIE